LIEQALKLREKLDEFLECAKWMDESVAAIYLGGEAMKQGICERP
jgi:hypothetical protein